MEGIAVGTQLSDGGLVYSHHYDRDLEAETEVGIINLLKSFQEWSTRNAYKVGDETYIMPIRDSVAMGEIRKVYSQAKMLCLKYSENEAVALIDGYLQFLTKQKELDTQSTIDNLEYLGEIVAKYLGQKHKFRDRTNETYPWDTQLKKKLEFPEMTADELAFYALQTPNWRKLCFLWTYYVTMCKGDVHCLLSGPNNSGKSNTALPMLHCCNRYLVDYWKVQKYNSFYIGMHPEAADVPQRRFRIKKDVYITPEAQSLKERFESEQYQTIDINEGMEAATNLQSMKSEAVALGIRRFTTRSYHNIVIWEYQVQQRPTALMLEGMNFWIQKMKKKHFVLSAASTLVRKKDPYYLQELEKCRSDGEISKWMRYTNPNYIATFLAPCMKPADELKFQTVYWAEKDKQAHSERIGRRITSDYSLMIEDIWMQINDRHTLSIIELGDRLNEMGFNKRDADAFMRDYGKFNRVKMFEKFGKLSEFAGVEAKAGDKNAKEA